MKETKNTENALKSLGAFSLVAGAFFFIVSIVFLSVYLMPTREKQNTYAQDRAEERMNYREEVDKLAKGEVLELTESMLSGLQKMKVKQSNLLLSGEKKPSLDDVIQPTEEEVGE